MKKSNDFAPVRVYRSEQHETIVKNDLQTAQTALQACLNVWNSLDLTACNDIFALILNPETVYKMAVNELAEVPVTVGRFQVSKEAYIQTLEIPIPDSLYRICRDARKLQFTNMPELWSVYGDQIVLNESEAEILIDSQSIYASGEKIKLAEDLQTWIKLTNSLNIRLNHELFDSANPIDNKFFMQKFGFVGGDGRGNYATLVLIPDKLRQWLQACK